MTFELFPSKPLNPSFGETYLDTQTGARWLWSYHEWVHEDEWQYCLCTGTIDAEITLEDQSVRKIFHPSCQREILPDFFETLEGSDIPVRLHWESEKDWETGYTESWIVLEPPRRD